MRYPYTTCIKYFRMCIQYFINFTWINIISTRNNHILFSIYYKEISILIHSGDISSIEPTISYCLRCFIRSIPVTFHYLWPSYDHLTGFTLRNIILACFKIYQSNFSTWIRYANTASFLYCSIRIRMCYRRSFSKAKSFINMNTSFCFIGLNNLYWQGSASTH